MTNNRGIKDAQSGASSVANGDGTLGSVNTGGRQRRALHNRGEVSKRLNQQTAQMNRYKRGGSLHKRVRVSYTVEEVPKDEDYLYCEDCQSFFIEECGVHGPPVFIPDTPTPVGVSDRARLTLPPGLEVRESSIPKAGLGVFAQGQTVPNGGHFGPYQGDLTDRDEGSGYSWMIYKSRQRDQYIDAKRETHSNWMRYVNFARNEEEQNLVAFQYRGGIMYRCCQPIFPGQELLVWYAKDLGFTFIYLWDKKCSANDYEDCQSFFIEECGVHGPPVFIPDTPTPMEVSDRARLTLPPGLEVRESSIPKAGLGVFGQGQTVPNMAHFSPYQGDLIDRDEAIDSGCSCVTYESRQRDEYVDAKRDTHSNWMSDSGDGLFQTQQVTPPARSVRRHRSPQESASCFTEDSGEENAGGSEGNGRDLENSAVGGFFKCTKRDSKGEKIADSAPQKRPKHDRRKLPPLPESELEEDSEEHDENGDDIRVVDQVRFIPLFHKRNRQVWHPQSTKKDEAQSRHERKGMNETTGNSRLPSEGSVPPESTKMKAWEMDRKTTVSREDAEVRQEVDGTVTLKQRKKKKKKRKRKDLVSIEEVDGTVTLKQRKKKKKKRKRKDLVSIEEVYGTVTLKQRKKKDLVSIEEVDGTVTLKQRKKKKKKKDLVSIEEVYGTVTLKQRKKKDLVSIEEVDGTVTLKQRKKKKRKRKDLVSIEEVEAWLYEDYVEHSQETVQCSAPQPVEIISQRKKKKNNSTSESLASKSGGILELKDKDTHSYVPCPSPTQILRDDNGAMFRETTDSLFFQLGEIAFIRKKGKKKRKDKKSMAQKWERCAMMCDVSLCISQGNSLHSLPTSGEMG